MKQTHEIVKQNIKSIASQSSIHGLPNVINTEYMVMRTVWLVFFILAIVYCAYLLVDLAISYFNYDVLISINYVTDYTIDFPSVAICDLAPLNRSLDKLVISCLFNSKPCEKSSFGKVVSTVYGACNVFNAYSDGRPILRSSKAGINLGLSMELFAGVPSQMPETMAITGLAVTIYNASSRPTFTEELIRIRPGQESSLMISRQEMRKLPDPYSKCLVNMTDPLAFDSDEYRYTLKLSRMYRQRICVSACSTATNTASIGETTQVKLVHNVSYCLEKCPEECNLIEFKVFQHFSHYPNDAYALELKNQSPLLANLSVEDIKQSVILLNVNYESMTTTLTEETPAMPFPTLLGNLGGQLGLFLGMSFLSFVEIFEMFFVVIWEYLVSKLVVKRTKKASIHASSHSSISFVGPKF